MTQIEKEIKELTSPKIDYKNIGYNLLVVLLFGCLVALGISFFG